jgi:hypothetical protein
MDRGSAIDGRGGAPSSCLPVATLQKAHGGGRRGATDRADKVPLYAAAGVRHVWLVDPLLRTLEVLRIDGPTYRVVGTWRDDAVIRAPSGQPSAMDRPGHGNRERPGSARREPARAMSGRSAAILRGRACSGSCRRSCRTIPLAGCAGRRASCPRRSAEPMSGRSRCGR